MWNPVVLPRKASVHQLVTEYYKAFWDQFSRERVTEWKIMESHRVIIPPYDKPMFTAVWVRTNRGDEVLLFRYLPRIGWWNRDVDIKFLDGLLEQGSPSPAQ